MEIFPHFNQGGPVCPVCKTDDDKPCTLIPITGTQKGHKTEAVLVHIDCIELRYTQFPRVKQATFHQIITEGKS